MWHLVSVKIGKIMRMLRTRIALFDLYIFLIAKHPSDQAIQSINDSEAERDDFSFQAKENYGFHLWCSLSGFLKSCCLFSLFGKQQFTPPSSLIYIIYNKKYQCIQSACQFELYTCAYTSRNWANARIDHPLPRLWPEPKDGSNMWKYSFHLVAMILQTLAFLVGRS